MKKNLKNSETIDLKVLKNFFLISTIEAFISFIVLLSLPKSTENAWLFGYSLNRMMLIFAMFLVGLILGGMTFSLLKNLSIQKRILFTLNSLTHSEKKLETLLTILSAFFLVVVFVLILWGFTDDKFYLAYLTRFGPIIVFSVLFVLQIVWLLLLNYPNNKRAMFLCSLLFGGALVAMQGHPLVINNKLDNLFLILLVLCTAFYIQKSFLRSFSFYLWGSWALAVVLAWLLIYLEFFFIPKRFLMYKEIFLTFAPLIITVWIVMTDVVYSISTRISKNAFVRFTVLVLILFGFIYVGRFYYDIGLTHAEKVNITYEPFDDELAYMQFAIDAKETGFQYTGTRNQMPIYPYIQGVFYNPGMTLDELFIQGKQVNIWLSIISLIILFFVVRKFLSLSETISLILIVAFGLYALKSGYFMAEILYYTLSFLAYLGMSLLLKKHSVKLSVVTGILLGLGHLTKASILPGFLLFMGMFILQHMVSYFKSAKDNLNLDYFKDGLKNLFLIVFCFLIVISPYIFESKKIYGSYFYNVNSTFYMWYDSYEEAINGTIAHGDGYGWPDMPADEIPSLGKYFREHSFPEIVERIRYGLHWQVENITYQYSFFNYPIFLSVFLGLAFLLNIKNGIQLLRENWALVLFVLGYLFTYFFLYVWYSAVSSMSRFLFALYVPLTFSIYFAVKQLTGKINLPFIKMTQVLLFLMVTIDIWYLISYGPFFRDFGS